MIQNMLREEALGSFRDGVTMESRKIVWACILLLAVLVFGGCMPSAAQRGESAPEQESGSYRG